MKAAAIDSVNIITIKLKVFNRLIVSPIIYKNYAGLEFLFAGRGGRDDAGREVNIT